MPDKEIYDLCVKDQSAYSSGSSRWGWDSISWWYISGYADGRAGYEMGTVNYDGARSADQEAYVLGWSDGDGDRHRDAE